MRLISKIVICLFCFIFSGELVSAQNNSNINLTALQKGFVVPPDSIKIAIFWHWLNNHISKEGVVKDLQAMKKAGINRVFIAPNIRNRTSWSRDLTGQYFGKVKVFSDEWWNILHIALKTAAELDIEIGLFNCPGWSQSGGPWIKPGQAMRYLASSELLIKGPIKISQQLVKPDTFFQDVKVIAFPVAPGYGQDVLDILGVKLTPSKLKVFSSPQPDGAKYVLSEKESTLDIVLPEVTTIRSLSLYPVDYLDVSVDLQIKEDTGYKSIQKFNVYRTRMVEDLAKGFKPDARFDISLNELKAQSFRLVFRKQGNKDSRMSKISLSATPFLKNYIEKSLAKIAGWTSGQELSKDITVPVPQQVLDISTSMSSGGQLNWDVPAGDWMIMRTGMRFIDVRNGPASFEAEGLEVDKMSKEHIKSHFNSFIGEVMRRVPAQDRKTFKVVVIDSYERGGQNFTDGFLEEFKQRYGYDATSFLPVFEGHIIGSADLCDRFLWDLRRIVADKISYDYVGEMSEISHTYGLKTWLENYGHSGFAGESLQYGGQSDEVSGEFWWMPDNAGTVKFEPRVAASAANIYGKKNVWAESFTSGSWVSNYGFSASPKDLKRVGDWAFTEGINSTLLHVYIHQPYEDHYPGIDAWYGTEFNRKNTWFSQMDLFTLYHKRSNFMLQQGLNVADVAYFIGEDVPKTLVTLNPRLPKGFNYDYINAEVILRCSVKDGRLVLPHGTSYRILILSPQKTMRPELLRKIEQLVAAGAVVLGPPPSQSPSLQGYPDTDRQVQEMAQKIWGDLSAGHRSYGKGMILNNITLDEAFTLLRVTPDCLTGNDSVRYTHRSLGGQEIYFLSNISNQPVDFRAVFRVKGLQPELWDAVTGTIRPLPAFAQTGETTVVPLQLGVDESAFIVFRRQGRPTAEDAMANYPKPMVIATVNSSWKVGFEHDAVKRGPSELVTFPTLSDWTQSSNERIRYYSGTAIYSTSLMISSVPKSKRLYLDLGKLSAMAKVKVNGVYVGGVWTAPYRVDVTGKIRTGKNTLEIEVVNNWKNRLIGDQQLPEKDRVVQSKINRPWKADSPLQASGLLGPVTLLAVEK